MHAPGSTNRLMPQHAPLFAGDGLFDRLGRTVSQVGVLPRKELYEAWEVARRVRRRIRGGRVVDLCCGHGLLGQVMLLLDDTSPGVLAVDRHLPPSHVPLAAALQAEWPRLQGRVDFAEVPLEQVELRPGDVVVSAHACGGLTDAILAQAAAVRASVAVLPCCHHLTARGDLAGWLDGPLALDVERAVRLRAAGYRIFAQAIPAEITPKNRLLLGIAGEVDPADVA
ncbi:MAG: methyltransferase [Deltaproteobacteria bacterium]|nr:methyltransferase [Deltaproteobacteria bacterium]